MAKEFEEELKSVSKLIKESSECGDSHDAVRFSQAALNSANAIERVFWLNKEKEESNK